MSAIVATPCAIPLTQGLVALVDADLYPALSQHRWCASSGYALRRVRGVGIKMHHEVLRLRGLPVPPGYEVDHINGNRSDNRSENLRVISHAANCRNTIMRRDNTTGYRGVYWDKRRQLWRAEIKVQGHVHYLGSHPTREAAFAAYEEGRERLGLLRTHAER